MYNGKTRKGRTRYLIRIYVQDRGGYGADAGCMTKVRGDREHEGSRGPVVTSGQGGRGAIRRSSLVYLSHTFVPGGGAYVRYQKSTPILIKTLTFSTR